MLTVATWNVNSVRQRISHLVEWLKAESPDIVCLQELKCLEEAFPAAEIEALGYNVKVVGQKTFNGVAILSRLPFDDVTVGLPGDASDEQARYVEGCFSTRTGVIRVASIYLPNGNPPETEKYPYKLSWMRRLIVHAEGLLKLEEPLVLAGDYNVIPAAIDAKTPEAWVKDALFLPKTRETFHELLNLGFTDALRATNSSAGLYTFWDYQAGAWPRNDGIRIDHLLLSPQAAMHLKGCTIDKAMRAAEKPSDHVPVRCMLAIDKR